MRSIPEVDQYKKGGIIGSVELIDCVEKSSSPWFCGPYGFVLKNAEVCDFVPCVGKLGFFKIKRENQKMSTDKKIIFGIMTGIITEKEGDKTQFETIAIAEDGDLLLKVCGGNEQEAQEKAGFLPDEHNKLSNEAKFKEKYPDGYILKWIKTQDVSKETKLVDALKILEKKKNDGSNEKKAQPPYRQKKTTLDLPVPVPDSDIARYGRDLAGLMSDIETLEEELEGYKKRIGGEMKRLTAESNRLRKAIVKQTIDEPIECEIFYDWEAGKKTIVRLDTNETVGQERITFEERQEAIDLSGTDKSEEGKGNAHDNETSNSGHGDGGDKGKENESGDNSGDDRSDK